MATDNSNPEQSTPTDPSQAEGHFKKWINEVLDEREAKAVKQAEERAAKDAENSGGKRTNPPVGFFDSLFGGR